MLPLPRRIEKARSERDQALAMILAGEPNEDSLIIWWADQDREVRRLEAIAGSSAPVAGQELTAAGSPGVGVAL